jgi:hypothetical protein
VTGLGPLVCAPLAAQWLPVAEPCRAASSGTAASPELIRRVIAGLNALHFPAPTSIR